MYKLYGKLLLSLFLVNQVSMLYATDAWQDVTPLYFKDSGFAQGYSDWSIDFKDYGRRWGAECIEMWNGTFTMTKQIENIPDGHYRLSVQALYRSGTHIEAYKHYTDKTETQFGYIYANGAETAIASEYTFAFDTPHVGRVWQASDNGTPINKYYPNSMETAAMAFSAGAYRNSIEFDVTNGKAMIEIYNDNSTNDNWLVVDNIKLELLRHYDNIVPATAQSLIINELMPADADMYMSPATNFDSWLELYNPTENAVTIGGYWISNDRKTLKKWQLPSDLNYCIIPAHGYRVIWMGSSDINNNQANFKLDYGGGDIFISDSNGNQLASLHYPQAFSRTAYARKTDGGKEWGWTSEPTLETSNTASAFAEKRLDAPIVSPDGQVFNGTLNIQVNIPQGTTLRYTTDGTIPTMTNGATSADGIFSTSKTINYRFRLFKEGFLPSTVVTRSYILNEYNHTLPIISITTADKYLYDDRMGIFVKGSNGRTGNGQSTPANWNMDWNRPVNFQFILPDNTMAVNQDVNMSVSGGWTRANKLKSFKLKASKVYDGMNAINHPFFTAKPYIKNKTLQIRAGGNDTESRIKDAALQTIMQRAGLNLDLQSYQPVVHYINGKYKGLINMREPNNKDFAYANSGFDDNAIEVYEQSPDSGRYMMIGTLQTLERLDALAEQASNSDAYEEIKRLVDIDEYTNYMAACIYLGSTDWPDNNIKAYRKIDKGRYRIVTFDLDFAFSTADVFNWFASNQWHTYDYIYDEGRARHGEIKFVTFFLNLLKNDEFRKKFIDTFCLMGGSVFDEDRANTILNELGDKVRATMSHEGMTPDGSLDNIRNGLKGRMQHMADLLQTYDKMKLAGVKQQSVELSANIAGGYVYINDIAVPYNRFKGKLFAPIKLCARPSGGYKFAGWKKYDEATQAFPTNNYYAAEPVIDLPADDAIKLQACFAPLTDDEKRQQGISPVRINEVSSANGIYVNDYNKKANWIELYNTTATDVDIEGMYLSDDAAKPRKYRIDKARTTASTIIPAHGHTIIWCDKKAPLNMLHASFKLNANGGCVYLMAKDGSWTDSLRYQKHNGDETVGRYPDGSDKAYLMNIPTIAKTNMLTSYAKEVKQGTSTGISPVAIGESNGLKIRYAAGRIIVLGKEAATVSIGIYTPAGRQFLSMSGTLASGRTEISTAQLAPGVYIVKAIDKHGNTATTKFVTTR